MSNNPHKHCWHEPNHTTRVCCQHNYIEVREIIGEQIPGCYKYGKWKQEKHGDEYWKALLN